MLPNSVRASAPAVADARPAFVKRTRQSTVRDRATYSYASERAAPKQAHEVSRRQQVAIEQMNRAEARHRKQGSSFHKVIDQQQQLPAARRSNSVLGNPNVQQRAAYTRASDSYGGWYQPPPAARVSFGGGGGGGGAEEREEQEYLAEARAANRARQAGSSGQSILRGAGELGRAVRALPPGAIQIALY